ncbi:MAG: TetR/AcrR family transcriptional regulator [Anaerolineaceae bacterium]
MTHNSTDLRVIKTKANIQMAMLTLLERKRFEDISITEIADLALVGRATFYRYYEDKYTLLKTMLTERIYPLASQFPTANTGNISEMYPDWLALFTHIANSESFYRAILCNNGSLSIRIFLEETIENILHDQFQASIPDQRDGMPPEVHAQYIISAFLGITAWWSKNNLPYPPEKMARWTMDLLMNGAMKE